MIYGYETLTLLPDTGSPLTVSVASQDLYTRTDEVSVRGDGSEGIDARTHTLEALVVDAAALATLERWAASGQLVRAFAKGVEASIVWDEPCRVRVLPQPQQGAGRHRAKVRLFTALQGARIVGPVVNLISGRFAPSAMPWGSIFQNENDVFELLSGVVTVGGEGMVTASVNVIESAGRQDSQLRLWIQGITNAGTVGYQTSEVISSEEVGTRSGVVSVSAPIATIGNRVRWRVVSTAGVLSSEDILESASIRVATALMKTPATQPVGY